MSEQAANSLLPASGTGGLAVGVWALRRLGMSREHIARRTAAFFFLTSMANVTSVILFLALNPLGILGHDPDPALTYSFGAAALIATALVIALPTVLQHLPLRPSQAGRSNRVTSALRLLRYAVTEGVRDGLVMRRQRSLGVIGGSLGTMVFDLAVLGVCFRAFGGSPPLGVLVLGYLIGQLGGNLPLPGGLGGIEGGLVGAFALYHQPLASTTAAVLAYHAISLWTPALLGSAAFVKLRKTLEREHHPASICAPAPARVRPIAQPVRRDEKTRRRPAGQDPLEARLRPSCLERHPGQLQQFAILAVRNPTPAWTPSHSGGDGVRSGENVTLAGVAGVGQRAHSDIGDVALVDQRPCRLTVYPTHNIVAADLIGPHQRVGGKPGRSQKRPVSEGALQGVLDRRPERVGPPAGRLGGQVHDAPRAAADRLHQLLGTVAGEERATRRRRCRCR